MADGLLSLRLLRGDQHGDQQQEQSNPEGRARHVTASLHGPQLRAWSQDGP
ncbi:MAG: hypothetical protein ACK6BG_07820 [Cyanobacteriota bacterium]